MAASCVTSLPLNKAALAAAASARSECVVSCKKSPGRVAFPASRFCFGECSSVSSALPNLVLFSALSRRFCRSAALAARASDLEQEDAVGEVQFDDFQQDIAPQGTKLYVGNLSWNCDSQQLACLFQEIGSVEMVEVIYDRVTGRSRGFGFVTMTSLDDANTAIERLDGIDFLGRTMRVNFPEKGRDASFSRSDRERRPRRQNDVSHDYSNKVFVGNLPWGIDDMSLEEMFSAHGKVLEAKVICDRETGRSRGFGFVTLSSAEEVNEAISSLDGSDIGGRPLRVNLASEKPAKRDFF